MKQTQSRPPKGAREFVLGARVDPVFGPVVLIEPYFDLKTPNAIGRSTGAQVLVMPPSVGGTKEITDYFGLFDYNVNLLLKALKQGAS